MLLQARDELGLDPTHSYVVGDAVTDIEAARTAGTCAILVLTGRGHEQIVQLRRENVASCQALADLRSALDHISSSLSVGEVMA